MAAFLYRYTHPRWNAPKPNAGKATYLANLEATDSDGFYPEAGQIRGSTYARSITGEYYGNYQGSVSYGLAGKFDRFQATLGIDDRSPDATAVYRVVVYGDDRIIATKDVRINQAVGLDVSVVGNGNLQIEATSIGGDDGATLVLGNARILSGVTPKPAPPAPNAPRVDYLSQMSSVSFDSYSNGTSTISGKIYQSSLSRFFNYDSPEAVEYNLSRKYKMFRASLGVDDSRADTTAQYDVRIYVDGVERYRDEVGFGEVKDIAVPVSGKLRLRIVATLVHSSGDSTLALGNARLEY
ncbi:NPCBM/NEW2 domain-containing protein [Kocuria sp. KD4]|uniref:NPCBM/NEW2 domain-containing protein n=1 Tax=Kocuria sp. KD4 TaxID=2719588 RepID=UPI0014277812|nr:NPCBM/NEW2 domain-containing protein [Kocuria sp. KD4]QIR69768.1 hypothetical protein HBK84_06685 [Kocuria sp. KD4]